MFSVDIRIKRWVIDAGILDLLYSHISNVIHEAGRTRGWRPGDLDAAMWNV
ncbi:hypothetical protein [Arthrobacter psychrochitiniphilus]|uniref:hypothetical protein n=1 Tax=Arthrobacter psychrochitiniphilus TaxID=291045 RepID=UPI0014741A7C|nr:hypothetical protein [Arthrobacter psychrochitiniphilus]NYG18103.1 hypothetical protein [Arthrobacter psychrochitiniphilus]